jgi:hypothetical protein
VLVQVLLEPGRRRVAQQLVSVCHDPVEQLGEPDRGPCAAALAEGVAQGGVEAGGAGQVVAAAAQQQVADRRHAGVAALGQGRRQQADVLPPVAQRGPGQALQALGQLRVGLAGLGVGGDGAAGEQLEGGLPEMEGGQVACRGRAGVVGPPVQLRQRQWQALQQGLVQDVLGSHGRTPGAGSLKPPQSHPVERLAFRDASPRLRDWRLVSCEGGPLDPRSARSLQGPAPRL